MNEMRSCEVCIVPKGKGCYIKMSEEINKTADILLEPIENLSEEENKKDQDVELAVNKEILRLRDEARENGCKNVNSIVADNKWKKHL